MPDGLVQPGVGDDPSPRTPSAGASGLSLLLHKTRSVVANPDDRGVELRA
jgi:hypothetical protein